jgi:prepilin-type processing-associated H-X9-DG protein
MLVFDGFSFGADGFGSYMAGAYAGRPSGADTSNPYLSPGFLFAIQSYYWLGDAPTENQARYLPSHTVFHYARHRRAGDEATAQHGLYRWRGPAETAARGRVNIGFADGHVDGFRHDELVNIQTGISRFAAMWTSLDPKVERTSWPPGPHYLPP